MAKKKTVVFRTKIQKRISVEEIIAIANVEKFIHLYMRSSKTYWQK